LCRVHVEGDVTPPTSTEAMRSLPPGTRLACQTMVLGDIRVRIPRAPRYTGRVSRNVLNLELANLNPVYRVRDIGEYPVKHSGVLFVAESIRDNCSRVVELADKVGYCIGSDHENILLVDLGTTKIAYQVYTTSAELVDEGVVVNPLVKYGLDIVTRLARAVDNPSIYMEMRRELNTVIADLINRHKALLTAVAGNSVMESMLAGLPLTSLAEKPFQPIAQGLFIHSIDSTPVLLAPLIAGFVGGDAFADLAATEYLGVGKPYLVIDLGTNTETMLVKETGEVYATSTPAGPAFEGYLSSGSTVVHGGIYRVRIKSFTESGAPVFEYHGEPTGLLGSGVISLVAELLRNKLVDATGRFIKGYVEHGGLKAYIVASGGENVVFTQRDMRELQKALAAVKTSWRILLDIAGVKPEELKYVVLSGSFGSSIDPRDAVDLGITPPIHEEKVVSIGNGVLAGLKPYVFDKGFYERMNNLLPEIRHVNLAEQPDYMKIWVDSLNLGSQRP